MIKVFLLTGAILAALAVILGAFAAHSLKSQISADYLTIFETGVRYQMYHALGLLMLALFMNQLSIINFTMLISGIGFISGIIIFSGSLYALSLTGIKWLGAITPMGGVAFIIGWICFAIAAFNLK
jgi:uncharacterized membrane protein YgdD (TMEM256/DUF423 family)